MGGTALNCRAVASRKNFRNFFPFKGIFSYVYKHNFTYISVADKISAGELKNIQVQSRGNGSRKSSPCINLEIIINPFSSLVYVILSI